MLKSQNYPDEAALHRDLTPEHRWACRIFWSAWTLKSCEILDYYKKH